MCAQKIAPVCVRVECCGGSCNKYHLAEDFYYTDYWPGLLVKIIKNESKKTKWLRSFLEFLILKLNLGGCVYLNKEVRKCFWRQMRGVGVSRECHQVKIKTRRLRVASFESCERPNALAALPVPAAGQSTLCAAATRSGALAAHTLWVIAARQQGHGSRRHRRNMYIAKRYRK
jgi:hypothetical protein